MIVSSDIDRSPNLLYCLILIPQTGARGLKLVLAVNFTAAVFICQENIHTMLSRVSSACLSDFLPALLCFARLSEATEMAVIGFHKISLYV